MCAIYTMYANRVCAPRCLHVFFHVCYLCWVLKRKWSLATHVGWVIIILHHLTLKMFVRTKNPLRISGAGRELKDKRTYTPDAMEFMLPAHHHATKCLHQIAVGALDALDGCQWICAAHVKCAGHRRDRTYYMALLVLSLCRNSIKLNLKLCSKHIFVITLNNLSVVS